MIQNLLLAGFVVLVTLSPFSRSEAQKTALQELQDWLAIDVDERPEINHQAWANIPISKEQAEKAKHLLWNDFVEQIRQNRKEEWNSKVIKLDELEMKFDFHVFGKANDNGRSLFLSMHGGGGAAPRVNDQQWRNQIGLYRPDEGLYLAPRAPTNTWNLWHQSHIDRFFQRIIQNAVVFENVDPNRVYIMGYSAGGDGVYQLAPRMADRLAAAAMMAGHPNDASPLGLRNIGFTLHMGGEDGAYNRNQVAEQWKVKLAELQKADPTGYRHEVVIHKGKGHWMDRQDAVAVPWMAEFVRDPFPKKLVWFQSGVTHRQFYWLAIADDEDAVAEVTTTATRDGQEIHLECSNAEAGFLIRLNDEMVDLDQPVIIEYGGQKSERQFTRQIATLYKTMHERGDVHYMFPAENATKSPRPRR